MSVMLYILSGVFLMAAVVVIRLRYTSFLAQNPNDYSNDSVIFDLRQHLSGPIECEGVIYGPFGRVTSRFIGAFDCEWVGDHGVMRERFTYDDGSVQDREWHLSISHNGVIKATASDVIGDGVGTQSGSAVQLKYRIQMPESAGGHVLDTVDWLYLAPNGNIINRSQFRKFGIQVAELVATMRPVNVSLR
jgi:hypothetical protein